jgi:hypothetical protein
MNAYAGPEALGLRRHHWWRPSRVLESILASAKTRTCLDTAGWLMLSWVANCLIERHSRADKRKIWRRGSLGSARKMQSRASVLLLLTPTTPALSCAWLHAGNPSLLTLSIRTLSKRSQVGWIKHAFSPADSHSTCLSTHPGRASPFKTHSLPLPPQTRADPFKSLY